MADDTEFNIFNTDRQLSSLEDAVKMLATLPEKKALVYFGSGVTRNGIDNDAQLRATINAALRSNVSFYPVDARGLVASSPVGNASVGAAGGNDAGVGGGSRGSGGNFSGSAVAASRPTFRDCKTLSMLWRTIPAANCSSTATTLRPASSRRRRTFPAITSSAITRPTPPWTASSGASR